MTFDILFLEKRLLCDTLPARLVLSSSNWLLTYRNHKSSLITRTGFQTRTEETNQPYFLPLFFH